MVSAAGPVWTAAYGRTAPGGQKLSADTPSGIGSVTKSFTALGVMLMAERGKIDLDAPVTTYLPWFRTADKENSDLITIRMLLSNTSGIPSADRFNHEVDASDGAMARGVRDIARSRTLRRPGESFEYANENWLALGVVLEAVSGLPYRLFMEKEVFLPLGMKGTTTDPAKMDALGVVDGSYWGPDAAYAAPRRIVAYGYAAGSELRSSARDMGAYLRFWLSGGLGAGGKRLLSAAGVAEMARGRIPVVGKPFDMGGSGTDDRYGYGLFVSTVDGRTLVNHGGNRANMSSFMAFDPAAGVGVCLLFTADTADVYRFVGREKLANDLLRLAAGQGPSDFGRVVRADPARLEATAPPDPALADAIVGEYRRPNGDTVRVRYEAGELVGEVDSGLVQGRVRILARGGDRFLAENLHGAVPGFFARGAGGKAVSISYEGLTFYRLRPDQAAAERLAAPDGSFSFAVGAGLAWSWTGPAAATVRLPEAEAGGSALRLERLDEAAALALDAESAAGGWLADSVGAGMWLEKTETLADGRLRLRAYDGRGCLLTADCPAEASAYVLGAVVAPLLASVRRR